MYKEILSYVEPIFLCNHFVRLYIVPFTMDFDIYLKKEHCW